MYCFATVSEQISFIHYIDGTIERRKHPVGLNVKKLIEENKKYIGKLGLFFDSKHEDYRRIGRLVKIDGDGFHTTHDDPFEKFKPLTNEQLKILEL